MTTRKGLVGILRRFGLRLDHWATPLGWPLALAITSAVLAYTLWWPEEKYAPLEVVSPQIVHNEFVEEGGLLIVSATKCNTTNEDVSVVGESHYRRIVGANAVVPNHQGSGVRSPGCKTTTFENQLPPGVTAGTWILEGSEQAADGDKRQIVVWQTERFTVVRDE